MTKIPDWIRRGLRHPMAAAAAMSLGIKLGQESTRLSSGDISREEFRKRAGQHVGSVTGTVAGAGAGAIIGRLWPGGGAVVGAFLGGMLGEIGGERLGRATVDRLDRFWRKPEPPEDDRIDVEPVSDDDAERTRRDL